MLTTLPSELVSKIMLHCCGKSALWLCCILFPKDKQARTDEYRFYLKHVAFKTAQFTCYCNFVPPMFSRDIMRLHTRLFQSLQHMDECCGRSDIWLLFTEELGCILFSRRLSRNEVQHGNVQHGNVQQDDDEDGEDENFQGFIIARVVEEFAFSVHFIQTPSLMVRPSFVSWDALVQGLRGHWDENVIWFDHFTRTFVKHSIVLKLCMIYTLMKSPHKDSVRTVSSIVYV